MKKSSKILLYGSIVSVLYVILCLFIQQREFMNKSDKTNMSSKSKEIIESVELNSSSNYRVQEDISKNSTLNYKIENGVVTIAGDMPILENNDTLKISMMKFCIKGYCDRSIIFSTDKKMPRWKSLAEDIIELFYEDNLTNASFYANREGRVTINGELLTQKSKDKIAKIVQNSRDIDIIDNTHLKVIELKETQKEDKNDTNISIIDMITKDSTIETKEQKDSISEAQLKISELLKDKKINFYRNRARITPKGIRTLKEVVKILKDIDNDNIEIEVKGYTDASGKRDINRWISRERAKSVKNYLGSHGINPLNIKAYGFGEDNLLYKDRPYSSLNRRVEIAIKRRYR